MKIWNGTVVFIEKQRVTWEGDEPMRGSLIPWSPGGGGMGWGDPLPPSLDGP